MRKMKIVFVISCIVLLLGLIIAIPAFYGAANSYGIIQVIGSLFGGDLMESDGFIWSRGGFEGTVYLFAAIDALGIITGTLLIVLGGFGIIKLRNKLK